MAPCSWCTDPDRNFEEEELANDFIQNVLRTLPASADARKAAPIVSGAIDYFPLALLEVARISKAGNDQHNPGQPLHWARNKSNDHVDCVVRHLIERGTVDSDGQRHTAKAAWRILALLQEELEQAAGWYPKPPSIKIEAPTELMGPDAYDAWSRHIDDTTSRSAL